MYNQRVSYYLLNKMINAYINNTHILQLLVTPTDTLDWVSSALKK